MHILYHPSGQFGTSRWRRGACFLSTTICLPSKLRSLWGIGVPDHLLVLSLFTCSLSHAHLQIQCVSKVFECAYGVPCGCSLEAPKYRGFLLCLNFSSCIRIVFCVGPPIPANWVDLSVKDQHFYGMGGPTQFTEAARKWVSVNCTNARAAQSITLARSQVAAFVLSVGPPYCRSA